MTTTDRRPTTGEPDPAASPPDKAPQTAPDKAPPAAAPVTERDARKVAEAARETEWRKPSFGKKLFLGQLQLDLIDPWPQPDPAYAEKGQAFLGKLTEFCRTSIDNAQIERDAMIPDEVITGLAELGAFGMKIDERYGGLGLSNLDYCRALMLVGSANAAVSAMLSAHQSIGVPNRSSCSARPSRRRSSCRGWPAVRSPRSCSPSRMRAPTRPGFGTAAIPDENGDYLLNGVKLWATNGTVANLLVVMAGYRSRTGIAAASPRSWSSRTARASPLSGATRSWACVVWRTASPGSMTYGCPRTT